MKHIGKVLLLLLLSLVITSCSIQTVEQYERMQDEERSIEQQAIIQDEMHGKGTHESKEEQDISSEASKATHEEEAAKQIHEQAHEDAPGNVDQLVKEQEHSSPETKPAPSAKPVDETIPQSESISKPEEKEAIRAEKRYVTIAIHAETLLSHSDKLDPALQNEKYVPQDGVILHATKYELLEDDETVWDVLLRATRDKKIHLEYQGASANFYNSVYVEGINHLYEFSAGSLSGWMYQVNDIYPSYGCGQYKLADGDVIEWHYTVDLGRDLGTGV